MTVSPDPALPTSASVVIIGGGIMGTSAAFHLAEAGVAAYYILKGADIIPDSIPEIGLTDDARILARVFERNATLRGYRMPDTLKA